MSVNLTREQQEEIIRTLGLGLEEREIETVRFNDPGVEIFLSSCEGYYISSFTVIELSFFAHKNVEEFVMWCNRPKEEETQGLTADTVIVDDVILEGKKASETLIESYKEELGAEEVLNNPVEQPKHYEVFPDLESIDVIKATLTEEEFRGFCKGNTLKYRLRAGKKDDVHQDIAKAEQYVKIYNDMAEV